MTVEVSSSAAQTNPTVRGLILHLQARQGRHITEQEIASRCGIAQPTLSNIITGRFGPSALVAQKLARVLEVSDAILAEAISRAKMNRIAPSAKSKHNKHCQTKVDKRSTIDRGSVEIKRKPESREKSRGRL